MKKLFRNLLFFSAIGSVAILASCGGDEEEPLPTAPSIEVEVEGVEVSGSAISAVEGETATFTVVVTAEGLFNTLKIVPSVDGVAGTAQFIGKDEAAVTLTEEGTVGTVVVTYEFDAEDVGKELSWEFVGVDDEAQEASKTFTATVEAAPVEVVVYTETLIGGQSNATLGSFYDAEENKVYKYAETRETHSASVDFLFFYGDTNKYAIAAMDDADANTAFSSALNVTNALSAIMPTKNATKFKVTALTAAQFDAIGDVDALASAYGEVAADASKVNNLEAGKVFAFVQASARGSKKGLVKVVKTDGTSGTNRSITVTVKIEPSED
ncbi:MAG: hypothetical protein RIF36_05735 [Imperialibacter sp.]|uniref:hypothetical protein n=1 Tax=Imperialibacter sp. TaxID=2038411 RepID=UPI0032EB270E